MVAASTRGWLQRGVVILAAGVVLATGVWAQTPEAPKTPETAQKPVPKLAMPDAVAPAAVVPAKGVPAAAFPEGEATQNPQGGNSQNGQSGQNPPDGTRDETQGGTQDGAGAHIRTGTVIGEGVAQNDVSRMTNLLGDHQYMTMEAILNAPESAGSLTQQQRDLFRGVLLNRENKSGESIKMLTPLVETMGAEGAVADPVREKLLRKTLAEDYLRVGDWANAAKAYQALDERVTLTPEEKGELELPLKLLPLAANHPAMTVEYGDPFSVPYDRDAIGLMDIPVFVDAQSHDWMLDPTAPFNLICRSTAKEVGLKLSEESATVRNVTGRPIVVHATVIPRFTLGNITFRNMTAFVFEDADYYYGKSHYQVRGVLGYPAVSALGSVTVTQSARIEVQPGEKGEHLTSGARFFLEGDRVMVALGKAGEERMFQIDASGQQTYLTSRYFSEHPGDFTGKKMQLLAIPGAASKPPAPAYVADTVTLVAGNTPMSLHYVQVLTDPLGNAAVDDSYGTLGVDVLDELKSYTFDYRTMLFGVRVE